MAWSYRLEAAKRQKLSEVVAKLGHRPLEVGRHNLCRMKVHPGDSVPSLMVYGEEEGFYCWGCHTGGGSIDYVMGTMGVGLWEAIRIIEDLFGLKRQTMRGDAGRTRARLAMESAERVRVKYAGDPVDLRAYASLVEASVRSAAEDGEGPRGMVPEVWREAREAYLALDRCVDRGAGREEMEDLRDYYCRRVADLVAAAGGLAGADLRGG